MSLTLRAGTLIPFLSPCQYLERGILDSIGGGGRERARRRYKMTDAPHCWKDSAVYSTSDSREEIDQGAKCDAVMKVAVIEQFARKETSTKEEERLH